MKSFLLTFVSIVTAVASFACPTALIAVEQSCNNYLFYLQETPVGNVIWSFGDETVTTGGIEIFHEYVNDGIYVVSATFSGPECPETITLTATVEISCGAVNECPSEIWSGPGTDCGVMNFEIGSFVDGENVIWYPGDESGAVTTGHFFSHTYTSPGTYHVCAFYTTPLCPDGIELCTDVVVEACNSNLCPTAIVAEAIDCDSYIFSIEGIDSGSVIWDFNDGVISTGGIIADHSWITNGVYIVTATVDAPQCPIMPPTSIFTFVYTVEVSCNNEVVCPSEVWAFETADCQVMEFELDLFTGGNVVWYPGDETGAVEGGQSFTHTYEFPGLYTVCAVYTSTECPDGIELCTNVVITDCNVPCNETILGIDSYVAEGGTTAITYSVFNAATGMIAAAGEATYTADSPFHDAPLCLPDGCYYISIDSNEPFALGTNINVFLSLNGSNILEGAEIINQEEFNITYFFGINSNCSGQPECYASFEPVYTNTPGHIEFINTSTYTGAASFLWDYGNGTMGDSFGGNVQYDTNGIYVVCLTITTENCQNTYCNFVNIDNMEVPCIYNEVSVIVDADYFEPVNELLEVSVSFGLEPIYSISLETNGIINDTLNFCVPDGCYSISVESGLPVQAQTIACSIEGINIQQLGDLQLNLGETSATAAIGVNMDCSIRVDESISTQVNAFPNPASDVIQFTSMETISRIEIFNLTGTRVALYNPNQTGVLIHTDEWSSGLYIARILRGKEFVSLPIEILH